MYLKSATVLAFLLVFVTQLPAQWGADPDPSNPQTLSAGSEECTDIQIRVKDTAGSPIMGAAVVPEDTIMAETTDTDGIVEIPCRVMQNVLPVIKISANGYIPTSVTLLPNSSYFTVRLDRSEPVARSAGTTINASELSTDVQAKSVRLQEEAGKALAHQDYDNAGKLLLEALQLTPSAPGIANNLGIVALRHKDLESAGSWFQKAAEEAPYKADILGNLGLVRWMQHRTDESYSILVKASSRGYESNLGHYILGTISLEKGQSREAAEHLKKVSADHFPYRDLYLSIALRNCGKNKAADESYRSFLRRKPAPFMIYSLLS